MFNFRRKKQTIQEEPEVKRKLTILDYAEAEFELKNDVEALEQLRAARAKSDENAKN